MAISLTNGGLLFPQIEPTYTQTVSDTKFYEVSLPIGVVCSIFITGSRKGKIVEFGGTCLIFERSTVDISGNTVMGGYSFPMYSRYSSVSRDDLTVLVLRLK